MWIEPVDQYLRSFSWNKVKYRADKPLGELIDLLQKVRLPQLVCAGAHYANCYQFQEAASIDNDIRSKYSQYNQVKNTLATLTRKQMCVIFHLLLICSVLTD